MSKLTVYVCEECGEQITGFVMVCDRHGDSRTPAGRLIEVVPADEVKEMLAAIQNRVDALDAAVDEAGFLRQAADRLARKVGR